MRKYANAFIKCFLLFLLGFAVVGLTESIGRLLYAELNLISEDAFPIFSRVTEKEEFMKQESYFGLFSSFISVFIINGVAICFDNERMEHLIGKTDGLYTLREGLGLYFENYLSCDVIIGLTVLLPALALSAIDLPQKLNVFQTYLDALCIIPYGFTRALGFSRGAVIMLSASVASRFIAAYLGIRRWRALWLSDIVD